MEIHNNDNIILLERIDLLDSFKDIPLEDISIEHFRSSNCDSELHPMMLNNWKLADIVMFIDKYNKTRILKNRWGGIGLVNKVPKTRNITITLEAIDNEPDTDLDMLDPYSCHNPVRFDQILKEYLSEISDRLNNVFSIQFKNIEIK